MPNWTGDCGCFRDCSCPAEGTEAEYQYEQGILDDEWQYYDALDRQTAEAIAAEFDEETEWRTKDGRVVKIALMGDRHLCNTILCIERAYAARLDINPAELIFTPQALDDFEMIEDQFIEATIDDFCPSYFYLAEEAKRRGLDPREPPNDNRRPSRCQLFRSRPARRSLAGL
jgi:hypothetical protein